jgi:hypothetical protein
MVRRSLEPPPGWRRLDAFHSPAETMRFTKPAGGGYHHVVDIGSYGEVGTWYVHRSVESGIFEESPDGSRPYIHTEVRSSEVLAEDVEWREARETALRIMRDASNGSGITGPL